MPNELSWIAAGFAVCLIFLRGIEFMRFLGVHGGRRRRLPGTGYGQRPGKSPDETRFGFLIAAIALASTLLLCATLILFLFHLERFTGGNPIPVACPSASDVCSGAPVPYLVRSSPSALSYVGTFGALTVAAVFLARFWRLPAEERKTVGRLTLGAVFLAMISGSLVPAVQVVVDRLAAATELRPVNVEPQWVVLPVMTASVDRPTGAPLLVVYFDNEKTAIEEGAQLAGLDLTLKAIAACVKGADEAEVMIRVAGFVSSSEWLNDQGDTRADSDASNLELAHLRAEFLVSEIRAAAARAGVSSQINVEPVSWGKSFQRMARARPFIDRTDSLGGPSGAERLNQIAIAYIDPENDCAP